MAEHTSTSSLWVSLQCLSRSEPLTRMAGHAFSEWVALAFELIRTTYENGWTWIQGVSYSLVLNRSEPLIEMATWSSEWVALQCLSKSEPLMKMDDYAFASRLWVTFQCLSRSEPLRTAVHVFRLWVALQCLTWRRSKTLTRITEYVSSEWVTLQCLSSSESLMSMHPACESLSPVFQQIRTTDENGWICIQRVSQSPEFEHIRITDEND